MSIVLQIVTTALNKLKGDLAGKYYPLNKMTKEEQQQLITVSNLSNLANLTVK